MKLLQLCKMAKMAERENVSKERRGREAGRERVVVWFGDLVEIVKL